MTDKQARDMCGATYIIKTHRNQLLKQVNKLDKASINKHLTHISNNEWNTEILFSYYDQSWKWRILSDDFLNMYTDLLLDKLNEVK